MKGAHYREACPLWQMFIFVCQLATAAGLFRQAGQEWYDGDRMQTQAAPEGGNVLSKVAEFVIQGVTVEGAPFHSKDWAVSLCDSLTRSGADGRKIHPSYVRPMVIDGVTCVVVRATLRKDNAEAFELIKRYIVENRLMIRAGRGGGDYVETTGAHQAFGRDRRNPDSDKW